MTLKWRTDKPPDEKAEYLVTLSTGRLDICWWTDTTLGGRSGDKFHWLEPLYSKVVAWLPLPEPYSDPMDKIAQYIEDNCDKFLDETYDELWNIIKECEE